MQITSRSELIKLIEHFELPKVAVEVGCAEGRLSKEFLASGFEKLYLVDLWESMPFLAGCASFPDEWHQANYKAVKEAFKGNNKVVILKGFSHKMSHKVKDKSVGLVYLDAAHDYPSVKSDIQIWKEKLVDGGILAMHDYSNMDYGVKRAVIEFIGEENVNIIPEDGQTENIGAWIKL